eukprot:763678-Hanusia_phi.AAC.3
MKDSSKYKGAGKTKMSCREQSLEFEEIKGDKVSLPSDRRSKCNTDDLFHSKSIIAKPKNNNTRGSGRCTGKHHTDENAQEPEIWSGDDSRVSQSDTDI